MLHDRLMFFKLIVVALVLSLATAANAEWKTVYFTQGNNIGLGVSLHTGGPLGGRYSDIAPSQFPRGSGNLYNVGNWCFGVCTARDCDGDGTAEDTTANLSRGSASSGNQRISLEVYDQLAAFAAAGEKMDDAAGRVSFNRVRTSLDADDLADWPAEFREGRSSSGAPILHGAETVCVTMGDAFSDWGAANGIDIEWQLYFLNFAESNNMFYFHVFFRNMSEYNKWNPAADFLAKFAGTPNGQVWKGMQLDFVTANGFLIGGGDEGWGINFAKGLYANIDRDGIESSFSGGVANHCMMLFDIPRWNGQEMPLTNTCRHQWTTEFGFGGTEEVLEGGYPMNKAYRFGLGKNAPAGPFYASYGPAANPWTGGYLYGWPGVLEPGDTRYNQWIWGRTAGSNHYTFWSEFHDFAPRDSFSVDGVSMFVYPATRPFALPQAVISEIDNADVQAQLKPMEDYADVARIVRGGDYVLPETPNPPALVIIPGDKEVTITWSDVNLHTPDAYYQFLQNNPSLDPNHVYREYDFEGYRLYRSFVGPSDAHSQLIYSCSLSAGDLQFFYKDTRDSDQPLYRMNNGMRVWYALVPYDQNYDPATGAGFSLPPTTSGKVWNRPGTQLYTVEPRSDASNFRSATIGQITYQGQANVGDATAELTGDGNGKLTQAPKWLQPQIASVELVPVNSERIKSDISTSFVISGSAFLPGGCNWPTGVRTVNVLDAQSKTGLAKDISIRGGSDEVEVNLDGPVDADGVSYSLNVTFAGLDHSDLYWDWDKGTYNGASTVAAQYRCGPNINSAPNIVGWTVNAQYTVTWKAGTAGNLTLEVKDVTRNKTVDFGEQPDDFGWGFVDVELIGDRGGAGDNIYNQMADGVPKAERTNKMKQNIAEDNTAAFGVYLNGIFWLFEDVTAMPTAGTVMTVTTAFGEWNDTQTVFTQYADPPVVGDKWTVAVNKSTMNAEDANLTKIMVVPNPYMASSFLDLSPDSRRIDFVNLPDRCTIRIYSLGGHLVNVLNHIGANRHGWGDYKDYDRLDAFGNPKEFTGYDNHGGNESWNLRNRFGQTVASGLYFFHVTDSKGKTYTGRFYIID